MSLKGMIIRCSSIIPEIREAVFRCLVCRHYSDPIVVDRGNYLAVIVHWFMLVYVCFRWTLFFIVDNWVVGKALISGADN